MRLREESWAWTSNWESKSNFLLLIFSSCLLPGRVTVVPWLLWNVQNPHIVERERSMTVVVLISGAFVQSRLIYESCLHLSDTFAYRGAHNNLFLTLRVIHKVKTVLINEFISILMSTKLTLSNEQTPPPTPFRASPKNLTHLPLDEWFSCNWCAIRS